MIACICFNLVVCHLKLSDVAFMLLFVDLHLPLLYEHWVIVKVKLENIQQCSIAMAEEKHSILADEESQLVMPYSSLTST